MQKFRKNETTGLHTLDERRLFDLIKNASKWKHLFWIKKEVSKKIDYINFEHLWMSNFMQEIRKNVTTGLQVLHEHRLFDVTKNASKLKCLIWT